MNLATRVTTTGVLARKSTTERVNFTRGSPEHRASASSIQKSRGSMTMDSKMARNSPGEASLRGAMLSRMKK